MAGTGGWSRMKDVTFRASVFFVPSVWLYEGGDIWVSCKVVGLEEKL